MVIHLSNIKYNSLNKFYLRLSQVKTPNIKVFKEKFLPYSLYFSFAYNVNPVITKTAAPIVNFF